MAGWRESASSERRSDAVLSSKLRWRSCASSWKTCNPLTSSCCDCEEYTSQLVRHRISTSTEPSSQAAPRSTGAALLLARTCASGAGGGLDTLGISAQADPAVELLPGDPQGRTGILFRYSDGMHAAAFAAPPLESYELVDSGGGEKLERFGRLLLQRPDPQALWRPALGRERWADADLYFVRESDRGGRWEARRSAPAEARGKDAGWRWRSAARAASSARRPSSTWACSPNRRPTGARGRAGPELRPRAPRLLNLFGYTGVASVLAAQAGYEVTHVDASKTSVSWTRENAQLSGLAPDALRLVVDDALAYTRREARRKSRYSVVLLDPPHHGRGRRARPGSSRSTPRSWSRRCRGSSSRSRWSCSRPTRSAARR